MPKPLSSFIAAAEIHLGKSKTIMKWRIVSEAMTSNRICIKQLQHQNRLSNVRDLMEDFLHNCRINTIVATTEPTTPTMAPPRQWINETVFAIDNENARNYLFSASFWDAACIRTIKRFRSVWKVNFTGRRSLLIWYQIVCITVNVFERCQPVVCKWTLVIQYQIVRNTFNVFGTKGCQPAICKRSKMFVNFILI